MTRRSGRSITLSRQPRPAEVHHMRWRLSVMLRPLRRVMRYRRLDRRLNSSNGGRRRHRGPLRGHSTSSIVSSNSNSNMPPRFSISPPSMMVQSSCCLSSSPCSRLPTLQVAAETVLASSRCGGCYFLSFVNFSQMSIRTYKNMSVRLVM